jgi:hypothetical protein
MQKGPFGHVLGQKWHVREVLGSRSHYGTKRQPDRGGPEGAFALFRRNSGPCIGLARTGPYIAIPPIGGGFHGRGISPPKKPIWQIPEETTASQIEKVLGNRNAIGSSVNYYQITR